MPTFIDEQGDTGLVSCGGQPYFRLASVWVPTLDDADLFRENVRSLRRRLGVRSDYEFKFSRTHNYPDRRRAFLETAMKQEFRFAVSHIDKTQGYWSSAGGSEIHWACATELAALLRPVYYAATEKHDKPLKEPIVVDENDNKRFLDTIKKQFRALKSCKSGSSMIGRVDFRDSFPDEMLQLVDMVCGSVGRLIDDADGTWYNIIGERDLNLGRH